MKSLDYLLDLLPVTGRWHLFKTTGDDAETRYRASWEEIVGDKKTSFGLYGATPNEAVEKLVTAIRGPIA